MNSVTLHLHCIEVDLHSIVLYSNIYIALLTAYRLTEALANS